MDQELPFIGRTRDRGDVLGSQIIAARVARAVMHLTFLLEQRWPPYASGTGTPTGTDLIGSVEMWCDNVDTLSQPNRRASLHTAYESWRL